MFINKTLDTFLVIFTLLVILILAMGDRTYPKVSDINLSESEIPVSANQIVLSFNREVDRQSVEENFSIQPEIPGRFSWIGKKMAYTFDQQLDYNQPFSLSIKEAVDIKGDLVADFNFSTQVESKVIFYLETDEQNSRLVEYNLNTQEKQYLTPEDLIVLDYKYAPKSKVVYFFATQKADLDETSFITDLKQLYSLNLKSQRLRVLADSKNYVNFEFDISPDEKKIALTRSEIHSNHTLTPRKLYLSKTSRTRFRPFWNKNIANAEIIFAPSSDAILGFNSDIGYLLVPIEPKLEKVVEFGWLEHLKSYGFSNSGNQLVFSTSNSIEGETNFITLFSRGNQRQQYYFNNNTDFIEQIQFLANQNKLVYLRNKDLSEHFLQILNLETEEVTDVTYDFKNLEYFKVSPNEKYLLVEVYDSMPGKNYGPSLRFDVESFENRFYSPELFLIDLQTLEKRSLELDGRKPLWKS